MQRVKELSTAEMKKLKSKEVDGIKNVIKLLQLFAEGHFSDLQNYIRHQANSYHSYNLLDDVADLLGVYMHTEHNEFFRIMEQCFDTLSEYIQGPCFENQANVIQGSFLDVASNLLSVILSL